MTRAFAFAAILSLTFPALAAVTRLPPLASIATPFLPRTVPSGAAFGGMRLDPARDSVRQGMGDAAAGDRGASAPDALIDDLAGGGLNAADPTLDGLASGPVAAGALDR